MSRIHASLRASAMAAALLTGVVSSPAVLAAPQPAAASKQAAKQLDRLAQAFYDARAKFDPLLYATANGDSRYNDQIGMAIAPAVRASQFALYHKMQKQLQGIDRTGLSASGQLNYDLLGFEIAAMLDLEPFPEHLLPLNQFDNVPSTLANYASGTGSQPLTNPKQYRDYLSRLNQLPGWIDQAIANMKQGMRQGVVLPKALTAKMLPQFQQLRSAKPEASIFYTPVNIMPAQFSSKDKQELTAGYRQAAAKIGTAIDRLGQFIENEYLPASRDTAGFGAMPNGQAWYLARIKHNTNLPLTAGEIHELGLKEVARIEQQMAELGPKLGYTGPAKGLAQWVSAQDKFKPFKTEAEVLDAYRQIYARVEAKLPQYFSLMPKARLDIQLEPELTRETASDHYTPPAADGSHPGVFWAVVNDPKKYNDVGMVSLLMHEGVPGHHLHAALLKELPLPDFRKFDTEHFNAAAYTEGWGLYSETLGKEFGLYDDPRFYYGHLNAELLRAVRLVVDTGMHAQGWSREKAIAYMADTLGTGEQRATNQIERYMAWPGQALSYKIGALKILELREKAQKALGPKFSFQKFHEVVLRDGTLPLPILEAQVERWIAREK
ncbi:DUF885 domain-containing protein [Massilia horti]|uniref:DUF885 domain-containing protein n=1 Tax=Massilia horti TaxID=2562153 RepID=A0A4Y9T3J8_9BURK|nr:DUF885 domain-containing protein [Massilia horti]TFW32225.1 DUF885 domain-containing protein [Massilia horti]